MVERFGSKVIGAWTGVLFFLGMVTSVVAVVAPKWVLRILGLAISELRSGL